MDVSSDGIIILKKPPHLNFLFISSFSDAKITSLRIFLLITLATDVFLLPCNTPDAGKSEVFAGKLKES